MDEKIKAKIERQIENPDWAKIESVTKQKKDLLKDLISDEGAIYVAVRELYPDFNAARGVPQASEISGRLIVKGKIRFVNTEKSAKQPIRDLYIATDDYGVTKVTLWGKANIDKFKGIEDGDAVLLTDVKISDKNGETLISVFPNSTVQKLDDSMVKNLPEMLEIIDMRKVVTSEIGKIKGLIIESNDKEYKTCPMCGGKVTELEDSFVCETHETVIPVTKIAKEITIDTGTGVISTMIWPENLDANKPIGQLDIIEAICRVYDKNYYQRMKSKANDSVNESDEVLMKKFPKELKLSIYSYETTPTGTSKPDTISESEIDVSEEKIN